MYGDTTEHPRRHVPRRILLQWHITNRCNLRCRHCYQEGYGGDELPVESLKSILRQFEDMVLTWRRLRPKIRLPAHVTVTGGEPLVRDDLFELLTAIRSSSIAPSLALLTNGTLLDEAIAKRLARLRPAFVQVSIEGGRATHEAIRGEGSFERAVAGLRRLVAYGVRTLISFSAHQGNYREFPEVARLGRELGVGRVWCDRVVPCGGGVAMSEQRLTPGETRELFELMRAARDEAEQSRGCRTEIAMHRALQFLVGGGTPYRCTAGDGLLTILPGGDLLPCRRLPITMGNVLETPLAHLYDESPVLQRLRDRRRLPADCAACGYRRACGGGLRCLAHALSGDLSAIDPGCWRPGQDVGTAGDKKDALRQLS